MLTLSSCPKKYKQFSVIAWTSICLIKVRGVSGAVLSAESSMLPQISLLTGKLTGKMNANSFYVVLKLQYLVGKADFS